MNGIPGLIPDVDDGFIMDVMDEIKDLEENASYVLIRKIDT